MADDIPWPRQRFLGAGFLHADYVGLWHGNILTKRRPLENQWISWCQCPRDGNARYHGVADRPPQPAGL